MNIRGVDVHIAVRLPRGLKVERMVISGQAPLRRRKAANVVVWPLDEERPAGPSELRAAYACALERCSAGKGATVVLPFYAAGLELPAASRIAAQEIFRFIRATGQPRLPGTIILWIKDVRDASRVRTIVDGYLGHIRNVLAWGPFVTVDTIIEVGAGVVLIRRKNPPLGWALPGGFVDYGESLEEAAAREAAEETGLRVHHLRQMHTYSAPGRDPRFQTVTTVFVAAAKGRPKAASDAGDARIFRRNEWKKLDMAFDHREVLEDYLKFKKS
ncbi:MAG: NUDIX hydrolase [Candidatus Omnitrophota bacterium]|jgi:ADP-ribose pyrophosphatase YjhB (NUDIX family)